MPTTRLAAIMFTDIVGYTAMMQSNRDSAITAVKDFEAVLKDRIASHSGELLQTYGDGSLSIFDSASAAVSCAKEIQEAIRGKVPLRIGIHLGEITIDGEHTFGDGVNIASRIESMGTAGAVLMSSSIRQQIKNKPEFQLELLGKFAFKNVMEPMSVYALGNEGMKVPKKSEMTGKGHQLGEGLRKYNKNGWVRLFAIGLIPILLGIGIWFASDLGNSPGQDIETNSPVIAVLAFDNLNNNPEQDYFSDGIADQIRNLLSAIPRATVISRTSSMYFKGKQVPLDQIAEELGVSHILEGSVQWGKDQLRINVQLTNTLKDQLEWAPSPYEGKTSDVFDFQSEIAKEVFTAVNQKLSVAEKERLEKSYTNDPEVYALYLQAKQNPWLGDSEASDKAESMLKQVLEKEPNYVPALCDLAHINFWRGTLFGSFSSQEAKEKVLSYLNQAKEIDSHYGSIYSIEGLVFTFFEWDFDSGEAAFKKAISLGDQISKMYLYTLYSKLGALEKIGNLPAQVVILDPLNAYYQFREGPKYFISAQYEKAIPYYQDVVHKHPDFADAYRYLGKAYLHNGEIENAIKTLEKGIERAGNPFPFLLSDLAIAYHKKGKDGEVEKIFQQLQKQWESKSGGDPAFFLGQAFAGIGKVEIALDWLEKSYEAHEVEMTWLKMEPALKSLHGNPRYIKLLHEVGF
ncbi:MAG: adenylate/guanylate cyclase domain-containing protein [Bacteroidia bacterium]|nr:adenylate/guanylate cyclase domain-containing protein [Bacteroidia bacterium]